MAAGYLYVLVNSAMPGLVKVGKTTRDPAERTQELSGVTGVPTPFVLAFDSYFVDCDAAEQYVHEELQRRGLREASNREFFRATPADVIRVLLAAPGATSPVPGTPNEDDDADLIGNSAMEDDDGLNLPIQNPWDGILEKADAHYFGWDDELQDRGEALRLYKQAARLGSLVAYEKIGGMYRDGEGVPENPAKALAFYKEGAAKGNYYCWFEMSLIFLSNGQRENWQTCWRRFFSDRRRNLNNSEIEIEYSKDRFVEACQRYIESCVQSGVKIEHLEEIRPVAARIYEVLKGYGPAAYAGSRADQANKAAEWVRENLLSAEDDAGRALLPAPETQERLAPPSRKRRWRLW